MQRDELLRRVKSALEEAFPERLRGVILYGSEARGEADPDSDIDLLVLLESPVNEPHDWWTSMDALYPLVLEHGRPIHPKPVDVEHYEAQAWPLYRNVRREGVAL